MTDAERKVWDESYEIVTAHIEFHWCRHRQCFMRDAIYEQTLNKIEELKKEKQVEQV
jgi:hypothetical protein